ncbi:dienelactone hydrolase [Martelella lutilitoris]|uniref:Dienelactone hydrolase n=1 Tax=Martelella lutilitoris TaxID=2583532 RepID=A0A5C4JMH7_9HYPH|nr:dienelactone hydrolase family protein [Martelella lutilitoris]TNB46518.1 dienelactone hydrolase [Martelella lutilitoris]
MMFRAFCLAALAMLCIGFCPPDTTAAPYHAGLVRIAVEDHAGKAHAVIWYPTEALEASWQAGPFEINASQGVAVATGRFPVLLLSHGHLGGPLSHRDFAANLARHGYIVVAPTHLGDAEGHPIASQDQRLARRPQQAIAALDAVFEDDRFASHADRARIGAIGYSAGGYTALILAGGKADFALASAYCQAHGRSDIGSCGPEQGAWTGISSTLADWVPPSNPYPIKALVLLDPLATMFDAAGLAAVKIPLLLVRPEDDADMKAGANALALAANLPRPLQAVVVPGRHFVFIDPCPEQIATEASLICGDDPGVDRASVHRELESEITDFLKQNL